MRGKFGKLKVGSSTQQGDRRFWVCECECGNVVLLTENEIINGKGCGQACLASRGEICAADLFNDMEIQYQVQKKFDDFDLRFDFYLPDYNVIIECDGAQHFRSLNNDWDSPIKLQETRQRDKQKQEYCKQHGITLLQVPFWDKEKLTEKYLREVLSEVSN